MRFDILTLFPEMFIPVLSKSIIGRAVEKEIIEIHTTNIRDFSKSKHKKVDDYPYGGGAGMVMQPQPIYDAYQHIQSQCEQPHRVIYLSPQGKTFDHQMALELAKEQHIVFLCGHYEGIDERVVEEIVTDEVSIGDFVLTGGEIPTMMMIDAISRLIPGVLSSNVSFEDESFYNGLLEYPQYTRPPEFLGKQVPEVLLSGNHKNIDRWRREQSLLRTFNRRPDLLHKAELTEQDKKFLKEQTSNCL